MWEKMAWLAAAGAAGTIARYWMAGIVQRWCGESFAWGTLAVNMLGCLLFGFIWTLAEERMILNGQTRLIVLTGFMGAFTTFSTFAFETSEHLRDTEWWTAAGNILAHNVVGLGCIFLGFGAGRCL